MKKLEEVIYSFDHPVSSEDLINKIKEMEKYLLQKNINKVYFLLSSDDIPQIYAYGERDESIIELKSRQELEKKQLQFKLDYEINKINQRIKKNQLKIIEIESHISNLYKQIENFPERNYNKSIIKHEVILNKKRMIINEANNLIDSFKNKEVSEKDIESIKLLSIYSDNNHSN